MYSKKDTTNRSLLGIVCILSYILYIVWWYKSTTYHSANSSGQFRVLLTMRAPWDGGLDQVVRTIFSIWDRMRVKFSLSLATTVRLPTLSSGRSGEDGEETRGIGLVSEWLIIRWIMSIMTFLSSREDSDNQQSWVDFRLYFVHCLNIISYIMVLSIYIQSLQSTCSVLTCIWIHCKLL